MKSKSTLILACVIGVLSHAPAASADAVTDWNIQLGAAQKSTGATASTQSHRGAIVHAAIFDAVNGLAHKYSPYFVDDDAAPRNASQEAAAVQAAYTVLVALFPAPAQVAAFDAQLALSLAALSGSAQSITAGRTWGESVAQQILAWRATDGFKNAYTYLGGTQPGNWRTPTAGLSGVNVQFATLVPFTMKSPSQFRPDAPYGTVDRLTALTTAAYAADVNEVQASGSATSAVRTAAQTDIANFWQAIDNADQNAALRSLVPASYQLVDTARFFALCSMAACDAAIAVYDAKYAYALWRPIDAIRLANTDNNPATTADPAWTPLVTTPRHPEYPSAHTIISGAMLGSAALILGDNQTFTLSTPLLPGVTRTYHSFSAAVNEVLEARIWIGFHFRTACEEGRDTGLMIACHAVGKFLRPVHDKGHGRPHRGRDDRNK